MFHKIITNLSYFYHKLLLHYKMIEMPLDSPILCFIQGHFLLVLKRRQSQGLQFQDLLPLASYKMGNR